MSARILVAVTHLLGAGHLTRAAALARALAEAGHAVVLASGGVPVASLRPGRAQLVQLPPLRVHGTAFTALRDADGAPATQDHFARRRDALVALVEHHRPDAVVTELYPFGRRALSAEFAALVAAAGARGALVMASVRDVLATPTRPDRVAQTHARLDAYDAVLVHGDPGFLPLDASWPVDAALSPRLTYTGYVDEGDPVPPAEAGDEILVSGGSSAAGLPLQEAALAAARRLPHRRWRVLVGGAVEDAAFAQLTAAAPANVRVERARPDFRRLLAACALSVSQAGYNTAVDLMRTAPRALLVPFEGGYETEQRLRAAALARAGLAGVLAEDALSADTLAGAVEATLARPRPAPASIALDGAARAAAVIEARLAGRAA